MLFFLQQQPIVVDVVKQPTPTQDISIDYVITMFQTAGVFLLMAAVGGLIVGAIFVAFKRYREASAPPTTNETDHVRLRI
jgi:hypothetical protein